MTSVTRVTEVDGWRTDNVLYVKGQQSCDDSSYDKRNLRLPTAAMIFTVDARAGKMAVVVQMRRERSLTSFNVQELKTTLQLGILVLLVPKLVLILCNLPGTHLYAHTYK